MKCLVFDVELQDFYEAELPKDYTGYYDLLKCDTFDIAHVRVGGEMFDVYVDDEGLLKSDCVPSMVRIAKKPNGREVPTEVMLVGNLVFTCPGKAGRTDGLDDVNIRRIRQSLGVYVMRDGKILKMVKSMEE